MDNLDGPEAECLKELAEVLKKHALSKFKEIVASKRAEWEETEIKIGVTGQSGVGKSTFINTYRAMTPCKQTTGKLTPDEEPLLATVGETHTTKEATPYPDPRNSKIQLYDLPGLGAPGFGRKKYLHHEKVNLQDYDFIIILTSERFREDDIWLFNKIHQDLKKPVFLVRNKTLIGVKEKIVRQKMKENKALEEYKKKCQEELQEHVEEMNEENDEYCNITHNIYFLDCHQRLHEDLDFSKLIIDCANALPSPKHDAVIINIELITPEILKEKYNTMKNWLLFTAALCSADALVPVPGTDYKIDFGFVKRQVDYYREQFGIDERTYKEFILDQKKSKVPPALGIISSTAGLALTNTRFRLAVTRGAVTAATALAIPGIGLLVGVGLATLTTYFTLKLLLDEIYEDAKKIYISSK